MLSDRRQNWLLGCLIAAIAMGAIKILIAQPTSILECKKNHEYYSQGFRERFEERMVRQENHWLQGLRRPIIYKEKD